MKRSPLIADSALAARHLWSLYSKDKAATIRAALLEAKRFVLDSEASEYFGEVVRDYAQLAVTANEFAIKPFPVMYVEFDFARFFRTVDGYEIGQESDIRLAYLYNGTRVNVFARNYTDGILMPLEYQLNTPWFADNELQVAMELGVSRGGLDKLLWGSAYNHLSEEYRRGLRAQHKVSWMLNVLAYEQKSTLIESMRGDLRNAVMLLLFLNQTRDVVLEDKIPAKQGIIHNKASVYLSHSVVRLNLNPKKRFIKLLGHQGVWRKEHDVRGHFCRDKDARESNCVHDWQEVEKAEDQRWHCPKCRGLMWWRKSHRRGHKEKGVVNTLYEVTG